MFARFDENQAMTLRVIKETKRYGRTDARTDGQRENSIPPTNKVCGGYNDCFAPTNVNEQGVSIWTAILLSIHQPSQTNIGERVVKVTRMKIERNLKSNALAYSGFFLLFIFERRSTIFHKVHRQVNYKNTNC